MKKETKVVISSDNVVVDFNPNDADHEEALNKANADNISSKVEFKRKLAFFEELMWKAAQSGHGVPQDMNKEIDHFTKSTGIELSMAQFIKACDYSLEGKLEVYFKEILAGKQTSVVGLKVGDTIKCWDGMDIPIVAIHTHCPKSLFKTFEHRINTRNDFSAAIPDRLEIVWPQDRFNADFPAIREAINSLKTVLSENGYMDVRRGLVKALNNTYGLKATIQDFVNLIEGNCSPIDFVLKTQSNTPLLQAKAGEDKSSGLMVTDSDGMVCFRKPDKLLPGDKIMSFARRSPRLDKQEGVKVDPNIRFWYDKFGVGHEIPPNKPMEAGSVKRNETYGLVYQSSINGGPIPSPDPSDEKERLFCLGIQKLVSTLKELENNGVISGHGYADVKKVFLHAFNNGYGSSVSITEFTALINKEITPSELYRRNNDKDVLKGMAESMKTMHRKVFSEELYDKFADALGSAYMKHAALRGTASREFLCGDIICIEQFKREFGIIFSIEDMNLFLNGVITTPGLLCKYVRRPYPGEKKIKTRAEYDLCLSLLVSLLSLFNLNRMDRESVERAKRLGEQLNVRFDVNIAEGDFLDILYRRAAPSHVLKKYATAEAIKGK